MFLCKVPHINHANGYLVNANLVFYGKLGIERGRKKEESNQTEGRREMDTD